MVHAMHLHKPLSHYFKNTPPCGIENGVKYFFWVSVSSSKFLYGNNPDIYLDFYIPWWIYELEKHALHKFDQNPEIL